MRPIWAGSLSFGLINIPIRVYSASKKSALKFKLLDKHDLYPISYLKVSRADNQPVKNEDIVKGYEYKKGDYIVLTDEDFEKANIRKTKTIDIVSFSEESEINPKYFEKPYYIEPDKKAEKAYILIREALKKSKKVGIAKFIIKDKEHIGVIKAEGDVLILTSLRFENEIIEPEGINLPEKKDVPQREMDIALMLIDQLTEHFNAANFKDTFSEEIQKVIQAKAKGEEIKEKGEEPTATQMKDLLVMLKKSLEAGKKQQ